MGVFSCFSSRWKNKKSMGSGRSSIPSESKNIKTLQVNVQHHENGMEATNSKTTSFTVPVPFSVPESSACEVKVINHDSPVVPDYEGGDEREHELALASMKRDDSDFNLQSHHSEHFPEERDVYGSHDNSGNEDDIEMIKSGHVSDPGMSKEEFQMSPKLKRSCSDLAMRKSLPISYPGEIKGLSGRFQDEPFIGISASPASVMSHRSADKVILKKHSSSQILPSRSQKLWWKLFLWSHRNLHRTGLAKPHHPINLALNQQGGYCSDTVDSGPAKESNKAGSPSSFYGASGMWPQNQWVALPTESTGFTRVDEWVKEASEQPLWPSDDEHTDDQIAFPPSPKNSTTMQSRGLSLHYSTMNLPEEITHANSVIQSLNASSTVAHIAGIGLKVIPSMAHLSSLRSLNLSGNFIVHIAPGLLPKGLHVLNLSRNRIQTIEGLRELRRLRVLDLSYNRIPRIGQGLSNCTLIKELYLSGNKISDVEGLHRLLKLTVLDLSFNKITTTKALGQLVANYNSLMALNLLGNPIQTNISDDHLRKTVCSLLPKLAFLNKQPVNTQKAREIGAEAIARAAVLGTGVCRSTRRKTQIARRVAQRSSSSTAATSRRHKQGLTSRDRGRHHHSGAKNKVH